MLKRLFFLTSSSVNAISSNDKYVKSIADDKSTLVKLVPSNLKLYNAVQPVNVNASKETNSSAYKVSNLSIFVKSSFVNGLFEQDKYVNPSFLLTSKALS